VGAADTQYQQYTAQGSNSTVQQVVFSSIRPPSGVRVDRRARWALPINVDFTGIAAAGRPLQTDIMTSNVWGLRAYPLANCVNTISVKLNTQTITATLSQYHKYLMRFGSSPNERNRYLSKSPSFLDDVPTYTDVAGIFVTGGRNPYAQYSTNNLEMTRAIAPWVSSMSIDTSTGSRRVNSFVLQLEEPLFVNPFAWSSETKAAFPHLTSIDINILMGPNLPRRLFAGGFISGGVTTGIPPQFENAATIYSFAASPQLLLRYLQPQSGVNVEPLYILPYYNINDQIDSSNNNVANFLGASNPATWNGVPPAQVTYTSNVYNWSIVPKVIYIYGRPQQSFIDGSPLGYTYPDVPLRINSIQLKWNSRSGLLSTATESDIFDLSMFLGADSAYPEWLNYNGSVLAIDPVLAFGTYPLEASGVAESVSFSFVMQYMGIACLNYTGAATPATLPYEIHVCPVYEGVFSIKEDWSSTVTGILQPSDLLNAGIAPKGTFRAVNSMGGGYAKMYLHEGFKGKKYLPSLAHQVSSVLGPTAVPLANERMVSTAAIKKAVGMGRRGKHRGGAVMSRNELQRRL
jgi:hypothetical protein